MKKTILALSTALSFGMAANAQVSIIPKAGVSLANVAVNEEENETEGQKSNLGLVAGVGFNLPLSEDGFFSIQPELLYIQKGFALDGTETDTQSGFTASISYKGKQVINYVELPLLAKISFGGETFKAYVNAGPSFGFGLNGKNQFEITKATANGQDVTNMIPAADRKTDNKIKFAEEPSNSNNDDISYYDSEYYNRMDLGVQFGGGVGVQAGPGAFLLDIRYGLGLSNFLKEVAGTQANGNNAQKADGKNRVFALTVGYAIPLGGK